MKLSKKQRVVAGLAGTAMAVAAGTGVAWAYWTTTGRGTGSASTAAGATDTLDFTTAPLDAMYPGDSSQDVTVTVKNTGDQSVYVTTVKAYLTVDAPYATAGCSASDYLLNGVSTADSLANAVTLTWTAQELAKDASEDATASIQFNDKATSQDVCKDATLTLHYDAS